MTVLQMYCEFKGWQGGTIHQAQADFKEMPLEEQSRFCGRLNQVAHLMNTASDIGFMNWFFDHQATSDNVR